MRRAVVPGSFDPVTHGHLDIVQRAAGLFDAVVVAVGTNVSKRQMFDVDERIDLLREAVRDLPNVEVEAFDGLLVDFCAARDARVLVKGLRAVSDFDYELQMAQMNGSLAGVETVFVPTSPEWSFLASSLVKEVARGGRDVDAFVPPHVAAALRERVVSERSAQPRD